MEAVQLAARPELLVGRPLKRMEDPKFITGAGMYVGDIKPHGVLYIAFVRSPHAHARITKIDVTRARSAPRVRKVLTGQDLGELKKLPTMEPDDDTKSTPRAILAVSEVNYVGEAIAAVVAEEDYAAEDAAGLVEVEYQILPAVEDVEEALKAGSPRVHEDLPDNIGHREVHEFGDVDEVFRGAHQLVRFEQVNQRVAPLPLEPRGVVASYDPGNGSLTVWISTQDPHGIRSSLSDILSLPESRIRVIAPDVGGGFGAKVSPYPEELVASYAAMTLGRPTKWIESRLENLMSMTHGRGQKQYIEAAVSKDGHLLGLKVKIVSDGGAYNTEGAVLNPSLTYRMAQGVYDFGAYRAEILSVMTNKVPQDAYRGAGRPEASYLIERTMDVISRRLKLDPVGVRRINYVKKNRFPFKTLAGFTYDTGDYENNLERALAIANYQKLRAEQREARERGRLVGIGLITWTEICAFGPEFPQTAAITVTQGGEVVIMIGGHSHGQGHVTPVAQIAADELGVDLGRITVNHGDTAMLPWSTMTAGSRSGALTGTAVLLSARKIKQKMGTIAASMLDSRVEDVRFERGKIFSSSDPTKSLEFSRVARRAYQADRLPKGVEPTLFEYSAFAPPNYAFPFGTHIALVDVDRETGIVKLLKYFAVDDCGKVLNPLIVEGQVHGGVVQGVGQALLEQVLYDENGQLLTSTLADYTIPSAESIPDMSWQRTETPTYVNPLGVKGIGEGGTIASPSAVVNAVEDALSEFGVTIDRMPLRSDYVKDLMGRRK